ncbi:SPASM domain-containing protein [Chloroflexota bacterium]
MLCYIPYYIGDCNNQSVYEIWNGKQFQHFRWTMLDGTKNVGEVCANRNIIKHTLFPEDVLRNDAERLKKCTSFGIKHKMGVVFL